MRRSRWGRFLLVAAVVLLALLLVLSVCAFQEQPYPPTLCEALLLFGTAAFIQTAAGAFIALLLEYWPAWEGLPAKSKRPIVLGFCLVMPLATLAVRAALCGAEMNQDTFYLAAAAGAFAFVGSQLAHIYKLPGR